MKLLKIMAIFLLCTTNAYPQGKPNADKKTSDLKFGIAFTGVGLIGLRGLNKDNRWWKKINDEFAAKHGFKPPTLSPFHSRLSRTPFWGSTLFGAYLVGKGLLAKYYPNNWIMTTKKLRTNRLESKSKSVYNRKNRNLSTTPSALFRSL
jgi:hypothetical protein